MICPPSPSGLPFPCKSSNAFICTSTEPNVAKQLSFQPVHYDIEDFTMDAYYPATTSVQPSATPKTNSVINCLHSGAFVLEGSKNNLYI